MSNKHLGLLERRDVAPPPDLQLPTDAEIDRIADKGEDSIVATVEKLGYVPPTVKKQREARNAEVARLREIKKNAQLPLAGALRDLGIKPFTPESIERYQKAMVKNPLQLFKKDILNDAFGFIVVASLCIHIILCGALGLWLAPFLGLAWQYGLFGCLVPVVSLIVLGITVNHTKENVNDSQFVVILVAGTGMLAVGLGFTVCAIFGPSRLEWRKVPLETFSADIPRPVLQTVAQIHEACPEAAFYVDELKRKPDPFIVVKLGKESYHVEVWKEPRFEGDRAA